MAAVQQLGSWGNGASLAAPDLARVVQEDPDEAWHPQGWQSDFTRGTWTRP